jgi:uncharacterized membrane protein YhaH (DUF805 family)
MRGARVGARVGNARRWRLLTQKIVAGFYPYFHHCCCLPHHPMIILFAIFALAAGLTIPALVFEKKDKETKDDIYRLSRLGFVGWFFGTYFLTMPFLIICAQIERASVYESREYVALGFAIWGLALILVSSRRVIDIGWSKWLLLLGAPFLFPHIGRFISFWWYVVLMCVPSKSSKISVPRTTPATHATSAPRTTPATPATSAPRTTPATPATSAPRTIPATPATSALMATKNDSRVTLMQNNQAYGPYRLRDLLAMWDSGHIAGNALYWHEGKTAYAPLASDIEKLRVLAR